MAKFSNLEVPTNLKNKENFLSEKLHYLLDEKVTLPIKRYYSQYAANIEFNIAKKELEGIITKKHSYAEKLYLLNNAVRHAEERAAKILGRSFHFAINFREQLAKLVLEFSAISLEEKITLFLLTALKSEITTSKYISKEQVEAAGQYYKEQANNFGVQQNIIASKIDQIITKKISQKKIIKAAKDKSKLGEEGKIIINSLRERNPLSKDKLEVHLHQVMS